jgi:hypothetical protein
MEQRKSVFSYRFVIVVASVLFLTSVSFGQASRPVRVLRSGNASLSSMPPGNSPVGNPELDPAMAGDDGADTPLSGGKIVNRSIATQTGGGPTVPGNAKAKSNPALTLSFQGLDHFDQRFANGGNQFSVEPPDQGLCAGNGFVLESANDVLRIFDSNGNALTGVVDLNTFYGYPAAINRSNGKYGPSITDPSCYFDVDTQRWFQVVLTLDRVGTTPSLTWHQPPRHRR